MSDVKCPHCDNEFDVEDHHESGEYNCPNCDREIWIEVDHITTYEASCLDADHNWIQPREPFPDGWLCTKCGAFKMYP